MDGKKKLEELVKRIERLEPCSEPGDVLFIRPSTIRSISDAYKAMEAERDTLRAEAGELVVAQYRISALEAAISRQVKNVERWMATGEPAGPEESKSIYEQLKSALEARHEG